MAITIQFRRGTLPQWTGANPILASGEPGLDLTNMLLKVGDGSRNWNNLPYISVRLSGGTGIGLSQNPDGSYTISSPLSISGIGLSRTYNNSPSGNYTLSLSTGLQSIANLNIPINNYLYTTGPNTFGTGLITSAGRSLLASNGHTHNVSDITNFNSAVSGLIGSGSSFVYTTGNQNISGIKVFNNLVQIGSPLNSDPGILNVYANDASDLASEINLKNNSGVNRLSITANDDTATSMIEASNAQLDLTNRDGAIRIFTKDNFTTNIPISGSGTYYQNFSVTDGKVQVGTSFRSGELSVIGSGNFSNSLFVNQIPVSVSGHKHNISDIVDFNSGVSGLFPTGTVNYIPKFGNGGSGLNNSVIVQSGNFIGIGINPEEGIDLKINDKLKASTITALNVNFNEEGVVKIKSNRLLDATVAGIEIDTDIANANFYDKLFIDAYNPIVNITGNLNINGTGVSLSGHTHELKIGDGSVDQISYLSSDRLNIVGTGGTSVIYDDSTNTISISGASNISNVVFTTGNQNISGIKTFFNQVNVSGNIVALTGYFTSGLFVGPTGSAIPVSLSGHRQSYSTIDNFCTGVAECVNTPLLAGTGISLSYVNGTGLYINASGGIEISSASSGFVVKTGINNYVTRYISNGNNINISYADGVSGNPIIGLSGNLNLIQNITSTGNLRANSGIFSSGITVNGTGVSLTGHSHTISDISNFNSGVSGLVNGIYAPLNSPALTGTPTAPTATSGTNTTQIATTAFVRTEVANLVASAPNTLDTLNELAAALNNDASFSTTVTNNIASKVSKGGDIMSGNLTVPTGYFTLLNATGINISGSAVVSSARKINTASGITGGASLSGDLNLSLTGLPLSLYNLNNSGLLIYNGSSIYATGLLDGNNINISNRSGLTSAPTINLNTSITGISKIESISGIFSGPIVANNGSITNSLSVSGSLTLNGRNITVDIESIKNTNLANFKNSVGSVTTVGTAGGPSAYGTYDQGGNTRELNDLTGATGLYRGARGGNYFTNPISSNDGATDELASSFRQSGITANAYGPGRGVRLASRSNIGIQFPLSFSTSSANITTIIPHGFYISDSLLFANLDGYLPVGISGNTRYWIRQTGLYTFQVSSTSGGSSIMVSTTGSGVSYGQIYENYGTFVSVGDTGNIADTTTYGKVDYVYRIGKYEVTNDEYVQFLNSVGRDDRHQSDINFSSPDEKNYGLYTTEMESEAPNNGIARQGAYPAYVYSSISSKNQKPIVFISWRKAARYVNWLHNGKPYSRNRLCIISVSNPGIVTLAGHGFAVNDEISFNVSTGSTVPGGLTIETKYLVKQVLSSDTFSIKTSAGVDVNVTSVQSEYLYVKAYLDKNAAINNGAYNLITSPFNSEEIAAAKQASAKYWIPTENEWYKAAYYDPSRFGAGSGGYWIYPTRSNTMPSGVTADAFGNGSAGGDLPGHYHSSYDITDFVDRVDNILENGIGTEKIFNITTGKIFINITGIPLSLVTDVKSSSTDLNYMSGVLPGTASGNRAIILNSNKSISGISTLYVNSGIFSNSLTLNTTGVVLENRKINTASGIGGGSDFTKDLTIGLTGLAYNLSNINTSGIIVTTGNNGVITRTISSSGINIFVGSGNGVGGNPIIGLNPNVSGLSSLQSSFLYSNTGYFTGLFVSSSGAFLPVSLSGHRQPYSSIDNFCTGVAECVNTELLVNSGLQSISSNNTVQLSLSGIPLSLYSLNTSGFIVTTGNNGVATRTISASGINILIGSGNGLSGNPIIGLNPYTSGLNTLQTSYLYSNSGYFNNLLEVNGTGVSLTGHTHTVSNITNFNSGVSGLLPTGIANYISKFGTGGSGLNNSVIYESGNNIGIGVTTPDAKLVVSGSLYTTDKLGVGGACRSSLSADLGTTVGLAWSEGTFIGMQFQNTDAYRMGVVGVAGSRQTRILAKAADNAGIITFYPGAGTSEAGRFHSDGKFAIGTTSPSSQLHVIGSGFFASGLTVTGLLTSNSGNFINSLQLNGSGVSVTGHSHTVSDISNFGSGVSGLLPVKDIIAGSGIQVASTSGIYTITAFGVAASSASSLITKADNKTGSTISKMSVVYINGGHGNRPTIQKSIASAESTSSKTYGITASNINDNETGDIVVFGSLIDVDTNQFGALEGSALYLSPSVSGGITATKPLAPNHLVTIGKIVRNHSNQGIIEVSIQNGFELYELHDVAVTGATNGQFLQYNSNSGLWIPSSSGNFTSLNVNGSGSFSNNITASGFIKSGGTSSQFLKADGSVDNDNTVVRTTGNQGINDLKTFYDNARFGGGDQTTVSLGENLGLGGSGVGLFDGDTPLASQYWNGTNNIIHYAYGGSTIATPRITVLENNGNVGIGTSSPLAKLHVDGSINVSNGTINVNDNSAYGAVLYSSGLKLFNNTIDVEVTQVDNNLGGYDFTPSGFLTANGRTVMGGGGPEIFSNLPEDGDIVLFSNFENSINNGIYRLDHIPDIDPEYPQYVFKGVRATSYTNGTSIPNGYRVKIAEINTSARFVLNRYDNGNSIIGTNLLIFEYDAGEAVMTIQNSLDVDFIAAISAKEKYFKIQHPNPDSGYSFLQYGSLESPYHGVRLTGKDKLKNGICEIFLPDYLKYLIHEEDVSIQLTNHSHHKILYVDKIDLKNNKVIIKGYKSKSGGPYEFYWSFTGIRKDVPNLIPEQ